MSSFFSLFSSGTKSSEDVPAVGIKPPYKELHSFEDRKKEADRILKRYPTRIPIIVEQTPGRCSLPALSKSKFLVPKDICMGKFMFVIRQRMKVNAEVAMFVFINNEMVPTNELISTIYETFKDKDGFLYMQFAGENTFGGSEYFPGSL